MLTLNSFKFFFSCFLSLSAVISFSQTLVTSNISKDTTWTATGSPYIITVGSLKINQGITLTIEPGVVIKIRISINIEGTLNAIGSETKPIIFTSLTDDKRGGDTNNDGNASMPRAGEWGNILVQASALSKFENCYFSYGGNSTSHGALAIRGTSSVKNCYFENQEAGLGLSITFFSKASIEKISFGPKELKGIGLSNTASVFADGAGAYTLPNYDELPFIIKNTITINDDEQIFAQPDQSFKIISGEAIIVRGLFEAVGTASKTIKFTSIKDDNISGDTNQDGNASTPKPGDLWKDILISKVGKGKFEHCSFQYGGDPFTKSVVTIEGIATLNFCYFSKNRDGLGPAIRLFSTPSFQNISFGVDDFKGVGLLPSNNGSGNYTLKSILNLPFLIATNFKVFSDEHLTLEVGQIVKFINNTLVTIDIEGKITAVGSTVKPIVFTSIKDDKFGGDSNQNISTPKSGDWEGFDINEKATAVFKHCLFLYGNDSALKIYGTATVENCKFFNNNVPISIVPHANYSFKALEFRNNSSHAIGIIGGTHSKTGSFKLGKQVGLPYLINRNVIFGSDYQLSISRGTVFKFKENGVLTVRGAIKAEGTKDSLIIFTSIRDDTYNGDTNNDGNSTLPDLSAKDLVNIKIENSSSSIFKYCTFYYGNSTMDVSRSTVKVSKCQFKKGNNGFISNTSSVLIDSSLFSNNVNGIVNERGTLTVRESSFTLNKEYDIKNSSNEDVDAQFNAWGIEDIFSIFRFLDGSETNLDDIFDKKDKATVGNVIVVNMKIPEGIDYISPNPVTFFSDTVLLTITGYGFEPNSSLLFCKRNTPDWIPLSLEVISIDTMKALFKTKGVEPGIYDVCYVKSLGDTIKLENGFILLDTEQSTFGTWIPFNVSNGDAFAGALEIPDVDNLFVLMKKADRVGYDGTWSGNVNLYQAREQLVQEGNTETAKGRQQTDIDLHLVNPTPGYYPFEIETTNEKGSGFIMFTDVLPELQLKQWMKGEILRPYGYDWWQVDVPDNTDTLFIRTEGYGKWSTIEVFFEGINENSPKWFFNRYGEGYSINASISKPMKGRYYIRYKDSAVLIGNDGLYADNDGQKREYLIRVDVSRIPNPPGLPLSITGISADSVGHGQVTFDIFGTGFSNADVIELRKEGIVLTPQNQRLNRDNQIWAVSFDMIEAPEGEWEVVVFNADTLVRADRLLLLEENRYIDLQVDIIARSQIRAGRWNPVIVEMTNNGNISALGVPVMVSITSSPPPSIKFKPAFHELRALVQDSILSKINWGFFSGVSGWEDIPLYIDTIDEITGENIRVLAMILPEIPAGRKLSLEFEIRYEDFGDFNIEAFALSPLVHPDSLSSNQLTNLAKALNDNCTLAYAKCADVILDVLLDFIPLPKDVKGCGIALAQRISKVLKLYANVFTKESDDFNFFNDLYVPMIDITIANAYDILDKCNKVVPPLKLAKLIKVFKNLSNFKSFIDDCPDVFDCDEDDKNKQRKRGPKKFKGERISSATPEDKFGIVGAERESTKTIANNQNFINQTKEFGYRIDYWNKPDASAPAVEVFIRDTLSEKFDLSSFQFTEIGFLRWKVPVTGQYFNVNVDMRPDFNLIVNVEGALNPITREVYWVHRALDPETQDLPYDPLAGFLPAVDTSWYNIGWVKYEVEPKKDLPSGTRFENRAYVNFDGIGPWGPAPPYGPWVNTFDFDAPSSKVHPVQIMEGDTSFLVNWSGNDKDGVGIESYSVFISEDNGEYVEWLSDTTITQAIFTGKIGKTYRLYSTSIDRVGNIETKDREDTSVSLLTTGIEQVGDEQKEVLLYQNYPNPFSSTTQIKFELFKGTNVKVEIFNLVGQLIKSYSMDKLATGKYQINWEGTDNLGGKASNGIYFYSLKAGNQVLSRKMVLQR